MLYLTSFGFGGVSYVAMWRRQRWLGLLYLLLYGTSVLHHAHYTRANYRYGLAVKAVDFWLCRLIGVTLFYKTTRLGWNRRVIVIYLLNLMVPYFYFTKVCRSIEPYSPDGWCENSKWHGWMHLFGFVGPLALLAELNE